MPDIGNRWFRRVVLLGGALALGACQSNPEFEALSEQDLLDQARQASLVEDLGRTIRYAEASLERTLTSEQKQEALYLSGVSRKAVKHRKRAFRHFETLMLDYPYSDFVPRIEVDLYSLGEWYLKQEPSAVWGDLFSGRPFGVEIMRNFIATFPVSGRADDALMQVADYYYSREEFDFAADKYQSLVDQYTRSEWYDLAFYRVGFSHLSYSRGAGYDDALLERARRSFLAYLTLLPGGDHRAKAEAELERCEELLARSQLNVAEYYLTREQDRGARIHFANVVLLYPQTDSAAVARKELTDRGWDVSVNSVDTLSVSAPGR